MSEKHTEYMVVASKNVVLLKMDVLDRIKNGWQCQGGVTIYVNPDGRPDYYQAMVK